MSQVAIVVGGSRGIGRAVVHRLAADGYKVAFTYNSGREDAEVTAETAGARTMFGQLDARDPAACKDFAARVKTDLGPVGALVNSAGIVQDNPIVLMTDEQWRDVIDVNLTGTFNMCRAVAFNMMKQRSGIILNISSIAGCDGHATQVNYAAAKAGVNALSKTLAKELAPYGIRVNALAPGFIETDMTQALREDVRSAALDAIPLGEFGAVKDVAAAASFLLSEGARYITGQVLRLDGGMVV